jgi:hypothetical protein
MAPGTVAEEAQNVSPDCEEIADERQALRA